MGYLSNFIVYTLAMVGVIVVALLVFKGSTNVGGVKKSKYLKVLDTMSLGPRKTLYIVSTGKEKFLIASDVDKTNLISKLENDEASISYNISGQNEISNEKSVPTFQETIKNLNKSSYMDKSNIGIKSSLLNTKQNMNNTSVMKNIAEKIRG